jgi:CRISPR-associated endonuclease/helicase Cas3
MSDSVYWAHSASSLPADPGSRDGWQRLAVHLEAVAALAGKLASAARPGDERFATLARLGGMLHDYGKYTDCFQQMIATGRGHCQHAVHGAVLSYFGTGVGNGKPGLSHIAAAIAGHHGGVPDFSGDGHSLKNRLLEARYQKEAEALLTRAERDCAGLRQAAGTVLQNLRLTKEQPEAAHLDLYTRMLSSCLVDADRLDSAGRIATQAPLCAGERLDLVQEHLAELTRTASGGPVKTMRGRVLADCLEAAASPARLFSLSVPTGGGKTLAAMAFALRRAALQPERYRRVIVVIPFLSIIEQNAQVYARVLGRDAVLEHHSGSFMKLRVQTGREKGDELVEQFVPAEENDEEPAYQSSGLRTETENWDAPLIVTTSVRFFESLFSNRPRDLRRVHNIARSIVILDEVQTLPRRLLGPLLGMIRELSEDWGVDFVFSTATQPAFERPSTKQDLRWEPGTLTEIVKEPAPLRAALKRAEIRWELDREVTWTQVAERALSQSQCLAIVNLRNHAGELYAEVKRAGEARGVAADAIFHLSTRMCAAHRLRRLDQIRERLKAGKPCYVVSTQLVEAGVDVDFPLVLRALAPLDSIVQAAGRADREGRRTAELGRPGGEVVVFLPVDNKMPPHEYAQAAAITETLARQALECGDSIQVDSAAAMAQYFERYYGESGVDLGTELVQLRQDKSFATLAQKFEMISSRTRDVFVPDDDEAREAIRKLYAIGQLTAELRRDLQRHTVGLNPSEFQKARGVLCELSPGSEIWIAADQAYNDEVGLAFAIGAEGLVL